MITPTHYMLLSAALFIIGVVGVMVRRNIIIIFMSIELILNAVNINLVALLEPAAECGRPGVRDLRHRRGRGRGGGGLGIILAFYRNKETINIDEMNLMRWYAVRREVRGASARAHAPRTRTSREHMRYIWLIPFFPASGPQSTASSASARSPAGRRAWSPAR